MWKMPWRNLDYATCIEDLRIMTKAFVPKPFYDYVDTVKYPYFCAVKNI